MAYRHKACDVCGPENFFDQIYMFAWFTGFLIAGGVYLAGMAATGKKPAPVTEAKPA